MNGDSREPICVFYLGIVSMVGPTILSKKFFGLLRRCLEEMFSEFFSVSMEFEGDFNEVVADVGLLKLQKKMRETINGALFISKWRVQSAMCSSKGNKWEKNHDPPDHFMK